VATDSSNLSQDEGGLGLGQKVPTGLHQPTPGGVDDTREAQARRWRPRQQPGGRHLGLDPLTLQAIAVPGDAVWTKAPEAVEPAGEAAALARPDLRLAVSLGACVAKAPAGSCSQAD